MPDPKQPHDAKKPAAPHKGNPAQGNAAEESKVNVDEKAAPTKPQNVQGHNVNRPQ